MKSATLQLAQIHRQGSSSQRERTTFDYVIDGESLARRFAVDELDLVGRLDCEHASNAANVAALLGGGPADFDGDRVMLFVCPECGDLGCGAITAKLTLDGDVFTWSDFRHENNYDATMAKPFVDVGPFTFAAEDYRRVLQAIA